MVSTESSDLVFQIKICGVASVEDAAAAVEAGADALGLNFFPGSPRCLDDAVAEKIVLSLPADVVRVGLFVNQDSERILNLCEQLGLDLIQLHGDEPPEYLAELEGRPVMKAFRIGEAGLRPVQEYLEHCHELGCHLPVVLVDGFREGQYGGTGAAIEWSKIEGWPETLSRVRLVLAGGLTPENVGEAIRLVRPMAVDTASGVEQAPGVKDAVRMRAFVAAARLAFAATSPCQAQGGNLS